MFNRRGASLIECLIAVILIAVLVTAAILALATARFQVSAARHHYQAANIARNWLEDIISGTPGTAGTYAVVIDPTTNLNGNLTISYPVPGTIDLTVTWNEGVWITIPSSETVVMGMQ